MERSPLFAKSVAPDEELVEESERSYRLKKKQKTTPTTLVESFNHLTRRKSASIANNYRWILY